MKNYLLLISLSINDIWNAGFRYAKDLNINILGELIQEFCAAMILIIVFAIYKRLTGETVSATINRIIGKKKKRSK